MSAQVQKGSQDPATRLAQEHAAVAAALPGEVVSRKRRREALDALLTHGLPSSREDGWKYASLRMLERQRFTPLPAGTLPAGAELPAPLPGFTRLTFVDGVRVPALSSAALPAGVTGSQGPQDAAVERLPRRSAGFAAMPEGRLALLNEAFARDAAALRIGNAGAAPGLVQLELLFVTSRDASDGASYPRAELELEPGAQAVLVERHVSAGSTAGFVNAAVTLDIGRGAAVHHYRLQQLGTKAVWLDTLSAVLAPDAIYRLHSVAAGSLAARSTMHVLHAGERADVLVSMASLGDRQQVLDACALIEHAVPRARTEQTFRGISAGKARVGFNSKVIVHAGAAGTDSRQSLKGLLAGPEAEIDVRPQLEIYTDDVKASHGATAGKLDEGMLFYLLSRGLSRENAQALLKWAFLEDVVSRIEVPELRRQIEQSLAGQMVDAAALQGAL
jgi:Fe-S cluster assembly protein SufD